MDAIETKVRKRSTLSEYSEVQLKKPISTFATNPFSIQVLTHLQDERESTDKVREGRKLGVFVLYIGPKNLSKAIGGYHIRSGH